MNRKASNGIFDVLKPGGLEQVFHARVYALYFPEELHAADLDLRPRRRDEEERIRNRRKRRKQRLVLWAPP